MKRVLTILLFTIVISTYSQDSTDTLHTKRSSKLGFNLYWGIQFVNFDNLNRILKQASIPAATSKHPLIGASIHYEFGRSLISLEGITSIGFTSSEDINDVRTDAAVSTIGINYGYKFYLFKVNMIPYLGVSVDGLRVEIQNLPPNDTNIEEQILNQNISKLHSEVLSATLGFRAMIPYKEPESIGIDFRYQIPFDHYWYNGDFSTTNAPELNVGGFKVGLIVTIMTANK
ncbi:MAG: hypothetical protein RLN88_13535 [Ekhidna sp.]|uniref:hypothetical protein n=1 Tax=Ekhidna sp. TaxID=2608089 RepID=UPI0032ECC539